LDFNSAIVSIWNYAKPGIAGQVRHIMTGLAGVVGGWGAFKDPGSKEQFVTLGTAIVFYLIGAGWAWWTNTGQAQVTELIKAQWDVMVAKTLAQAQIIRLAKLPKVTTKEIAQQSNLTLSETSKVISTLPPEVQSNIAPSTATKIAVLLLFIFAVSSMFINSSFAAVAKPVACVDLANLLPPGCKPVAKTKASSTAATSSDALANQLQTLMNDITSKAADAIGGVITALQEADADAATLTNENDPTSFRDAISHACYPAQIKFLQSMPQIVAIKSPAPYNVIVLFQRKRDLISEIRAGLPSYLKVGCSALLQDETQILVQTLGLIGVTVGAGTLTGLFPPAAPLTLPLLALPAIGGG
jgi:hypothetical protein